MPNSTDPTPEAVLDLARRDSGNLGRLLDGYRNYLTMLAQLQVGDRLQGKLDASDLVQETFLEAHQEFPAFRGKTERELIAWLRKILASKVTATVRRFCDAQRRDVDLERRLHEIMDRTSQIARNLAMSQTSPSEIAARRERAVLLADALAAMPVDYRQVILLRDLRELSFPEVAQRMGRSADAVRKLWVRALGDLHRLLAERFGDVL